MKRSDSERGSFRQNLIRIFSRTLMTSVIVITALGSLTWGFWALDQRGFFNLTQIEILVEEIPAQKAMLRTQVAELQKNIETLRGISLFKLPLAEVSNKLQAQNWIEESQVSRRWPETLRINLKPSKIYLLHISNKGFRPVIADGSFLAAVKPSEAPDVPHLRGAEFDTDLELRKSAVDIIKMIPERGKFALGAISEIHHDSKEGFWATLMGSQTKIKLGYEKVSLKSARINQVLTYLDQRGLNARVIDADLSQKVLVRLRKDP
ncbi:MAG: FtsQ-type POTRA domain-containing protein [Bdellovibrionota bacterium]